MNETVGSTDESLPLFVYGTLLFGEVIERVIGRRPAQVRRAAAPSWSARLLPGEVFPGLVPDSLSAAGGLLLDDLTSEELQQLDDYEGPLYRRERLDVVDEYGRTIPAVTYLVDPELVTDEVWTSRWFLENHLEAFLIVLENDGF